MTTATTNSFASYDRSVPIVSADSHLPSQNQHLSPQHQHLDDKPELMHMQRQHPNVILHEDRNLSRSIDDLTQLNDHTLYHTPTFGHDFNDSDEEIHVENTGGYDYETAIQDRLKKANEVFEHDTTPAELTHPPRVSFDAVVKAVDIVQDPGDDAGQTASTQRPVSPVVEEPAKASRGDSPSESSPHEYTVPLNDTQPKDGPTLVQQIRAMQLYGSPMGGERRSSSDPKTTNGTASRAENPAPSRPNDSPDTDASKSANGKDKSVSALAASTVLVSKNGQFELQTEDDYTARRSIDDSDDGSDDDDDTQRKPTSPAASSTQSRPSGAFSKPATSNRSQLPSLRPKSSDNGQRRDNRPNGAASKSSGSAQHRAKSAGVSSSIESFIIKRDTSVDFDELNRKAAEKKRAEQQEQRRRKERLEARKREDHARSAETYAKWLHDKDAERRRFNEEKRLEREEEEARQEKCKQELDELREKKFKEWIARKDRDVMLDKEFKKLQADEEEMKSAGSFSSIQTANRQSDHRAFRRWLRQKYEQGQEEKRRQRLETRRLRRHQRRSIKHFQLQRDLQLARSFGYT